MNRSTRYAREIAEVMGQVEVLRRLEGTSYLHLDLVAEEAIQSIDTTIEELRVVLEELESRNEELAATQQLLEQERIRYRELFDQAPDVYLETDTHGIIREANRAAAPLLNIKAQFLIGKPLVVFISEPQRSAFLATLQRLRVLPETAEYDFQLKPRDGACVDVTLRVSVARNTLGEPIAFRWLVRDVSARRQAEQTIRKLNDLLKHDVVERSEQLETALQDHEQWLIRAHAASAEPEMRERLFENLVQEVDAILWTMDPATGRYTFVSRRAGEVLGYPTENWLDDPGFWTEHIHPDDREWAIAHRRRQIADGNDFEAEYRLVAADGRVVWFREGVRVLRDEQGHRRELCGLMVNISRRKKVERQLYTAKSHLAARLDDMTSLYELGLRLVGHSAPGSALQEILTALTAHLGTDQGAVFLDDRERDELTLVASLGLPDPFAARVGRLSKRSGALGPALVSATPVVIEDVEADPAHPGLGSETSGGGFRTIFSHPLHTREGQFLGTLAVFFRDRYRATSRHEHLVRLYAQQVADLIENGRRRDEVEDQDRRAGESFALIVHELRNPIGTILNALHLLEPDEPGSTGSSHAREVIERQAQHMARLVDDLLDVTRLRTGKLELNKERVDLAAIVQRAVESTEPLLAARRHQLAVALPNVPVRLLADPTRLEQVLDNLLSNAAKYTEPGGRITLAVEPAEDQIVIRVRDNGVGIAPELLPHVFDLYIQAEPDTARSAKGLGIGLWLVSRLVERHGGQITALSEGPGSGSEFLIRLPTDRSSPVLSSMLSLMPPAPTANRPVRARRVLIVDDHPDWGRVLARLVNHWNHEARVVHDGPSALVEAGRFHPDIVLLDIKLPGMDGYEVARRLRESPGGTGMAIVGLSGNDLGEEEGTSTAPEFNHRLVKPVDPLLIRRLIEEASAPHEQMNGVKENGVADGR